MKLFCSQSRVTCSRFPVSSSLHRLRFAVIALMFAAMGVFASSCGNDTEENKSDSVPADTVIATSGTREIQTDSGKLVITQTPGEEFEQAVLLDPAGKILARGSFYQDRPLGAWLRYDASGNVISAVHYSDGQPKYDLDPNDFITKRVTMDEMGISFAVPVNWDTVSPFNPKSFVSYEKNITSEGLMMKPNINIAKGTLEPGQTLEQLAAQQLNLLHETVGRVELVDESYLTIDSCKSFRRYGMYYTEDNKVGFLDAIIVHGNTIYVISCAARNREQGEFLRYQSVFENLVMSVQVND